MLSGLTKKRFCQGRAFVIRLSLFGIFFNALFGLLLLEEVSAERGLRRSDTNKDGKIDQIAHFNMVSLIWKKHLRAE